MTSRTLILYIYFPSMQVSQRLFRLETIAVRGYWGQRLFGLETIEVRDYWGQRLLGLETIVRQLETIEVHSGYINPLNQLPFYAGFWLIKAIQCSAKRLTLTTALQKFDLDM